MVAVIRRYNIFFISDTHFTHVNALTFFNSDGSRMRPFESVEECDELMIENWNNMIGKNDKVYHLGDVGFNQKALAEILPRLNGVKVLVKGNHDKFKPQFYLEYFKDIRGCHNLDNYLLSHFPVHPDSKARFIKNIHGHVHNNTLSDEWYVNASVEVNNYAPIPYEEILQR